MDVDVHQVGGRRWSGRLRLTPPLAEGTLVSADGKAELAVTGRVVSGRRTEAPLMQLATALVGGPWGWILLVTDQGTARVDFDGASWHALDRPLRVVRMRPDPTTWMQAYLTEVGRVLGALHRAPVPPHRTWELARLRLVVDDGAGAALAVRQGIGARRPAAVDLCDVDDLRALARELRVCGCREASAELSAYLDDLSR